MAKVISLINQKGGVGKTTTSINLSASLAILGKKTLLIDFDPQGNATTGIGINKSSYEFSIYDAMLENIPIEQSIIKTPYGRYRLDIIPATIKLSDIEDDMFQKFKLLENYNKNMQLKKIIEDLRARYDYIIIDCPPSLGILTTNALSASDSLIIPVQCEFFALEGITQILNTIAVAKQKLNPELQIEGVLLTLLDSRTLLGLEVVGDIRKYFKEKVYNTIIPKMVKLAEAPSHGKPIAEYDSKCRGTEAYINLAKEVIERNGK